MSIGPAGVAGEMVGRVDEGADLAVPGAVVVDRLLGQCSPILGSTRARLRRRGRGTSGNLGLLLKLGTSSTARHRVIELARVARLNEGFEFGSELVKKVVKVGIVRAVDVVGELMQHGIEDLGQVLKLVDMTPTAQAKPDGIAMATVHAQEVFIVGIELA